MFISLAGRNDSGKYTVLVGDPQMAADVLEQQLPDGAMKEVFDDIANQLTSLGFNVVRNPLPLVYDDDDESRTRIWYFATSNNAIIQDKPKVVWLPTYGHGLWSQLWATDERNKEIWESLGYEVKQLADFHPFAANLGAAHCISKYIARN